MYGKITLDVGLINTLYVYMICIESLWVERGLARPCVCDDLRPSAIGHVEHELQNKFHSYAERWITLGISIS